MDSLPLPDLYLIDSHKLLKEVTRIRELTLAIPPSVVSHSAHQTVVDALWRLERDMVEILKVQAAIHRSFSEKADKLREECAPPRVGLRVVT
jgi:chemotaxis signal transduction protein